MPSGLLARWVNWLVRDVKIDRLRVRDLLVGDNTTILTNDYIEFDALASDPAVAPAGKARLCAVSGDLRVSYATAYSTVGSGGGGGSADLVARAGLATMRPVGAAMLETTVGAGVGSPAVMASASPGSIGARSVGPATVGSAALI